MYFNNLEYLLSVLYPKLTWKRKTDEKVLYLSFDDGPIPEVTPFVLDQLDLYNAKATFFCVVENLTKNPSTFQMILDRGHKIGNHTFNHLNGWKTDNTIYLENIEKADYTISNLLKQSQKVSYISTGSGKKLFRPPYGKIKRSQIKAISPTYEIVMWDVLTGDFNQKLSPEKCLNKAIKYTREGSIIIFHDSIKAMPNLEYALPRFLKHFTEKGFRFESL